MSPIPVLGASGTTRGIYIDYGTAFFDNITPYSGGGITGTSSNNAPNAAAFVISSNTSFNNLYYSVYINTVTPINIPRDLYFTIGIGVSGGASVEFVLLDNPNTLVVTANTLNLPTVASGNIPLNVGLIAGSRVVLYAIVQQDTSDSLSSVTFGINAGLNMTAFSL